MTPTIAPRGKPNKTTTATVIASQAAPIMERRRGGTETCKTCRAMHMLLEQDVLSKMPVLENLITKLEHLNKQLATLAVEQRQETRCLREDDMVTGRRQYAEVTRETTATTTLLVGNRVLRDVHTGTAADGSRIMVRQNYGASLQDSEWDHDRRRSNKWSATLGGTREMTDTLYIVCIISITHLFFFIIF